jgi:protein-L-isoaspartate(D-aspartate) O-methyltransferase
MVERQIEARGIHNPRILAAMRDIPRHLFIPPPYDRAAYDDCPLPIGNGQTISQPYIVAAMTELIRPAQNDTVLEVGAGCGYQAAVLGALAKKVTTIERIPAVADLALRNIAALNIANVEIIVGDGTHGYLKNAPYNGIIITAATPKVPGPLIDQMADGGRLVAPRGGRDIQELVVLEKAGGMVTESFHGGVRFVPLIGEHGWEN